MCATKQVRLWLRWWLMWLLLLIPVTQQAADGFYTRKALSLINKEYGRDAYKRAKALDELIQELQGKAELEQIREVNRFFNQFTYVTDQVMWGESDYWASPTEFIAKNGGDCEDYVISKYFSLRKLGIDDKKLFLTYVKATEQNVAHMVLSYFEKPTSVPLILDNYNPEILVATKRSDLLPVYSFNANSLFLSNSSAGLAKALPSDKVKNSKWEKLLAEMEQQKI